MLLTVWLPVHFLLKCKWHRSGCMISLTNMKMLHVIFCYETCWVWFVWNKKAWHLLELNYKANQAAMETVDSMCVCCVCADRIPSEGSLSGPDLVSSWKRQGPSPLWQTSAFALRPVEISNLCLTCRKGQAHPWLPSGVETWPFPPVLLWTPGNPGIHGTNKKASQSLWG